jgi:large subunit ribosomal protein L21
MIREVEILFVNRYAESKAGDLINLKQVLWIGDGPEETIGGALRRGGICSGDSSGEQTGEIDLYFQKKHRQGYERRRGHRQELSVIKIESISAWYLGRI